MLVKIQPSSHYARQQLHPLVANGNLYFRQAVQHVEFGEIQGCEAVHGVCVFRNNGIKPAATALTTSPAGRIMRVCESIISVAVS